MTENSEETLHRVLSSYQIGFKLRQLRLRKKVSLTDLGRHTGLSASMLSQLETGRLTPTLPTLARIAMVFDVGLDHFFGPKRRTPLFTVVHERERIRFPESTDVPQPSYFFECLAFAAQDKSLQAYLAEFPCLETRTQPLSHMHPGAELIHVLSGSLAIYFDEREQVLEAGDTAYFDGSEPHHYRGLSAEPARALVITTPPRV